MRIARTTQLKSILTPKPKILNRSMRFPNISAPLHISYHYYSIPAFAAAIRPTGPRAKTAAVPHHNGSGLPLSQIRP